MSDQTKQAVTVIAEALAALPESKAEYILGFAEGVLAMRPQVSEKDVMEPETAPQELPRA